MLRSGFLPRKHVLISVRTFSRTPGCFAGHNKWSKIKQRKGIEDAKKSKTYGKAALEIITAAKIGGSSSPEENSMLATAIRRAKEAGVPKENIENAIARAERTKGHGQVLTFEAMMNASTGLIIECRSDNINRTVGKLREILHHHGARPAPVKFLFQQRGYVKVQIGDDMEKLLDRLIGECPVDFAEWRDEVPGQRGVELVCRITDLSRVTKLIEEYAPSSPLCEILASEVNWAPLGNHNASEEERTLVESLVEDLQENDDIERVFTTLEPNHLIVEC
ncbi:transcriptional regulator TACO1-like protein [Pisolithus thermaeus]|nr:transcriptional regulator TACO1-like protein [Pisolithus croceorrhizus]KAI6167099.1 transcriptional regulator TACO1-like protein [Pisolithus thermaeus]